MEERFRRERDEGLRSGSGVDRLFGGDRRHRQKRHNRRAHAVPGKRLGHPVGPFRRRTTHEQIAILDEVEDKGVAMFLPLEIEAVRSISVSVLPSHPEISNPSRLVACVSVPKRSTVASLSADLQASLAVLETVAVLAAFAVSVAGLSGIEAVSSETAVVVSFATVAKNRTASGGNERAPTTKYGR